MSESTKALDTLLNVETEGFKSKASVALMDKREAHLAKTALSAVADRMEQKGDAGTAERLRDAASKLDADQIHIVYQAGTA